MSNVLRVAVMKQFLDNWSGSNVCPGRNHDYRPHLTESWVKIYIDSKDGENAEIGTGMQRVEGRIVVECYVPIYSGEKEIALMEDEVMSIFQNKNFDGVSCQASDVVKTGPSKDSNWYQHDVSTTFRYDNFS